MNRYKPIGWRNDSYRHSLAARGIVTSRSFAPKFRVGDSIRIKEGARALEDKSFYELGPEERKHVVDNFFEGKYSEEQEKDISKKISDFYGDMNTSLAAKGIKTSFMAFNPEKKAGYPIFDYPESFGRVGKKTLEDPDKLIDEIVASKSQPRFTSKEEFLRLEKMHARGDDSNTGVEGFKKLIKSDEEKDELPPIGIEYDENGKIVFFEGMHRLAAAHELGEKIPVIKVHKLKAGEEE